MRCIRQCKRNASWWLSVSLCTANCSLFFWSVIVFMSASQKHIALLLCTSRSPSPFCYIYALLCPDVKSVEYHFEIHILFHSIDTHTQNVKQLPFFAQRFSIYIFFLPLFCVACLVPNNNENSGDKGYNNEKQRDQATMTMTTTSVRCVFMWLDKTKNRFKKQLMFLRPGLLWCVP